MIGHVLALDLKSMKLLQSMSPTWLLERNVYSGLIKIKPSIKLLRENLRKKRTLEESLAKNYFDCKISCKAQLSILWQ
jgi:hypothetical protein